MALRVSSPWWLAAVLLAGLVALFMGERAFAHTGIASQLSWLGCVLVAAAIALRGWVLRHAHGDQRSIERISLYCHVGLLAALGGYWLTTSAGISFIGIGAGAALTRWTMVVRVLWLIALIVSLAPLLLIEVSLGVTRRSRFRREARGPDASVEMLHVREMASSGLSIALAAAFLMVTCNIADERNIRKDVSYFKTSSPGTATVRMVLSLAEPLEVLLFFPENNEVAPEVEEYVRALASKTKNVAYGMHDRLIEAELAKTHRVGREGTIVLVSGEKAKSFNISPDLAVARKRVLRELDGTFQEALMSVIRDTKTAYFSVGHGESNDAASAGALGTKSSLGPATLVKKALVQLNYTVKDYAGLGRPVPDDCSLLFVLAPRSVLLEDELRAIDAYLAKGGSAIIAMDPQSAFTLGPLEERLGVAYDSTPLADDKEFMVRSNTPSDHSLLITNQFLSHASIATVSRGAARSAMVFLEPGSFVLREPAGGVAKNYGVIRSMASAFRDVTSVDLPRNHQFDEGRETRERYNIVVAVEGGPGREGSPGGEATGMRVVLLADADVLGDDILGRVAVVQNMFVDVVKWAGGEEAYAGVTRSERDTRIEHTKSQDAAWFYGTMVGAPLFMLGLGLLVLRRRRTTSRRMS